MIKNRVQYMLMLGLILIADTSCERQQLEELSYATALIPVLVNWDKSGITPMEISDQNEVHRVSFRFFPKDGSEPFERYLETDVYNGFIEIPVGEYSIIAMNESVSDIYWSDYYTFSDINDYNKMSATVVDDDPLHYDFYKPSSDERFMKEAQKLVSWSMDNYTVTDYMVMRTRTAETKLEESEFTLNVEMRRLTFDTKVLVHVTNLKSVLLIRGAIRGFSKTVFLSSAKVEPIVATQFFTLNDRKFDDGSTTDGTIEKTFRSFYKLPQGASYSMMLDVVLINGTRYVPPTPFEWDVTDDLDISIDIEFDIKLPEIEGDIGLGDWDDDEIIIIK